MPTTFDLAAVLLAASICVPLAAWRLVFLRPTPLRFWASHPWITALIFSLTTPMLAMAIVSRPRFPLLTVVLLAAVAVELLVITVSIVHGLRIAWKRSRRQAALITAALLLTGVVIAGFNPGTIGVFWWMVAAMCASVGWCVLMAVGAEFLQRRCPE
jgi:hypothetical protein